MSLLLEALKKAELAKQAMQQHQETSETTLPLGTSTTASGVDLPTGEATASDSLDLSTTKQGAGSERTVITRDSLPKVDQAMELVPDRALDIGPSETTNPRPSSIDLRLDETLPPTPSSRLTVENVAAAAAGAATVAGAALGGRGPSRAEPRTEARGDVRETTQPNKPWLAPVEDREAARQVFQAKGLDYNPRRPFFLTLGALGAAAVATGVYFWWQLQPPSNFRASPQPATAPVNVAKAPSPAPAPVPAPSAPISVAPPVAAPAPTAPVTPPSPVATTPPAVIAPPMVVVPELTTPPVAAAKPTPPAATVATPPATVAAAPATAAPAQRVITAFERVPVPTQPAGLARPAPAASAPIIRREPVAEVAPRTVQSSVAPAAAPITVQRSVRQLEPAVERGYSAFQAGDLETARKEYLTALRADPFNRDALLGLAAIDVRTQNYENAELRYQRVLESDPRDPHAQAGLMGLRGYVDPVQSESRTKNLIAQYPESAPLQFALGNQLAAQGRWTEAQAAYFKAFSADPENADYAFNLAVSLDQIRQRKLALEYYQRALNLASTRQAVFDRTQVSARVAELQK